MSCNTQKYNLGICSILIGSNRPQKTCIVTKDDVSSSLNNKFIVFHEPVTQAKHYFWFDVGGAGVDPSIPNATGHSVAISANATKQAVASALNAVINPLTWINSTVSGNEIETVMQANGYAYEARDALNSISKTWFTVTIAQFGSLQYDAGATNGDITLTLNEFTKEIKSPQTGDFIVAEIRKGSSASASFELKDTSTDAIRKALNNFGQTIVTDDSASDVITGYGSNNLFKSTSDVADQIILRPTDKAADADPSADITIHKARLKLGELKFSAENELVLPMEMICYLDSTKSSFVNLFSYGNGSSVPNA